MQSRRMRSDFPSVKLLANGKTVKRSFFFVTVSFEPTDSVEISCCLSTDLAQSDGKGCSCQLCIYIMIYLFGESDFIETPKIPKAYLDLHGRSTACHRGWGEGLGNLKKSNKKELFIIWIPHKVDLDTPFWAWCSLRNSSAEKSTAFPTVKEIFPESSTSGQYFILRQLKITECCLAWNSKSFLQGPSEVTYCAISHWTSMSSPHVYEGVEVPLSFHF